MNSKCRVKNSLAGRPVDRSPVTAIYNFLIYNDHFSKLTGEPQWRLQEWLNSPDPESYLHYYRQFFEKLPFEILQPHHNSGSRQGRENLEFIEKDGKIYRHFKESDKYEKIKTENSSGHALEYAANEDQKVFDVADVDKMVTIIKADDQIASGKNDFIKAVVSEYGNEHFIMSGGVEGTFYSSHIYLGLTNLYLMINENPKLLSYLSQKLLEQKIEDIRCMAAAGGDAIYIDDAMTTNDMISIDHYERFSLPYVKQMVEEIHNLGKQAILIYFGGIADRLEQIVSTGADGLVMEASMKTYTNDIESTVRQIGERITLFSNLNPIQDIQDATDAELESEICRQYEAGKQGRGFIFSPASPITPGTSIERMNKYIELGKKITKC